MDRVEADATPAEEWLQSLNATCNRLSTQYLNLLRAASSVSALEEGHRHHDPRGGYNSISGLRSFIVDLKKRKPFADEPRLISSIVFLTPHSRRRPHEVGAGPSASAPCRRCRAQVCTIECHFDRTFFYLHSLDSQSIILFTSLPSSLQCQLAAENICVATSQLLSLIRTLRLSLLIMDEGTIEAEEELELLETEKETADALQEASRLEQELMELRRKNLQMDQQQPNR